MKICIAYESKYGNGKQCMEYLRDILDKNGHDVTLVSIREQDPKTPPEADLYVFSTPTQMGGPARKMKKFMKKFQPSVENAHYALVTTFINPKALTLEKMAELLQEKGITKVTNVLKIQVTDMKGPCEEGHQEKLTAFADKLVHTNVKK